MSLRTLPDTSYLPEFHLQTLAEDVRYVAEVMDHCPSSFFRPDDRTALSYPGYWKSDRQGISYIRFITKYGSHPRKEPPIFLPMSVPVRVLSREAKRLSGISSEECAAAYRELKSPTAVLEWLKQKYPDHKLDLHSTITLYRVEYELGEKSKK